MAALRGNRAVTIEMDTGSIAVDQPQANIVLALNVDRLEQGLDRIGVEIARPYGNLMSPPELSRDAPVTLFRQPTDVGISVTLWIRMEGDGSSGV